MIQFSHKGDCEDGFDNDWAFYHDVKVVNIESGEATEDEIRIYYAMKAEETRTLCGYREEK